MEYSSPELVVIGRAEALVLGVPEGQGDHIGSQFSRLDMGFAVGLDD